MPTQKAMESKVAALETEVATLKVTLAEMQTEAAENQACLSHSSLRGNMGVAKGSL